LIFELGDLCALFKEQLHPGQFAGHLRLKFCKIAVES